MSVWFKLYHKVANPSKLETYPLGTCFSKGKNQLFCLTRQTDLLLLAEDDFLTGTTSMLSEFEGKLILSHSRVWFSSFHHVLIPPKFYSQNYSGINRVTWNPKSFVFETILIEIFFVLTFNCNITLNFLLTRKPVPFFQSIF
jgi:hypothetical protein